MACSADEGPHAHNLAVAADAAGCGDDNDLLLDIGRAPRHLHSFPTRRSSDLRSPPRLAPAACVASPFRPKLNRRSEEHTSELQSQSNLVCRLLLEKKKHISSGHLRRGFGEQADVCGYDARFAATIGIVALGSV